MGAQRDASRHGGVLAFHLADDSWCRCRRVRKRGYRNGGRHIATVFGKLGVPLRVVECCGCGAHYSPLLNAISIGSHARKAGNFEREVIEAVIDTNYRRWIDGRSRDKRIDRPPYLVPS